MQSHLREHSDRLQRRASRGGGPRRGDYLRVGGLACEQSALLRPVQRQIEFAQPRRGQLDRLLAFEDRLDQPRAQEGQADKAPDVASADAITLGQFLKRSNAAGGQLCKPRAPACERSIC